MRMNTCFNLNLYSNYLFNVLTINLTILCHQNCPHDNFASLEVKHEENRTVQNIVAHSKQDNLQTKQLFSSRKDFLRFKLKSKLVVILM